MPKEHAPDRASDERLLAMLAMRMAGASATTIGKALGVPRGSVTMLTDRVAGADRRHRDPKATPADYDKAYGWGLR